MVTKPCRKQRNTLNKAKLAARKQVKNPQTDTRTTVLAKLGYHTMTWATFSKNALENGSAVLSLSQDLFETRQSHVMLAI